MDPCQGEVYLAIGGPVVGHQVIIVSQQKFNRGNFVVAVPSTSKRVELRRGLPNCVHFESDTYGFSVPTVAQCEGISLIRKEYIDLSSGPLATLAEADVPRLVQAIGEVIDATCLSKNLGA